MHMHIHFWCFNRNSIFLLQLLLLLLANAKAFVKLHLSEALERCDTFKAHSLDHNRCFLFLFLFRRLNAVRSDFLAVLLVNVVARPHLVEAFCTFHVSVNCDRKSKQSMKIEWLQFRCSAFTASVSFSIYEPWWETTIASLLLGIPYISLLVLVLACSLFFGLFFFCSVSPLYSAQPVAKHSDLDSCEKKSRPQQKWW